MPIRVARGRSAAYRGLWQWPLRSPARLGVSAVLVIAAVAGVVAGVGLLRGPTGTAPAAAGSPEATAAPGARDRGPVPPTVLPPVPELTPTTLPVSAAPGAALSVAARWSAAWVNHPAGAPAQRWLDGLRPFTTDEYLGVLGDVDPVNIPNTKVTGEPRAVRVAPRSVVVDVPTSALTLRLTVVQTDGGGWRVSDYDRR